MSFIPDIPDGASLLQQLFMGFQLSQQAGYMNAAVMTFLLCDMCTTIFDEIDLIWKEKWSIAKVLYLIARYYPPVFTAITLRVVGTTDHSVKSLVVSFLKFLNVNSVNPISDSFFCVFSCQTYFRYIAMGGPITFTTMVNIVFIMRIHALYRRSRKVLIFFTILCLVEFGVEFYISWVVKRETADATFKAPIPGWYGCLTLPISVGVYALAAWSICAGVGFLFLLFTVYKFKESLRDDTGRVRLELLKDQKYISPLLTVFMRDGALFFLIIVVTLIVSAILTAWKNAQYGIFALPWVPAVYSFVGSHMVLDLKKAGNKGHPTRVTHTVGAAQQPIVFARSFSENQSTVVELESAWPSRH